MGVCTALGRLGCLRLLFCEVAFAGCFVGFGLLVYFRYLFSVVLLCALVRRIQSMDALEHSFRAFAFLW